MKPNWIRMGALFGAFAIVTGAFGAHALQARLAPEDLDLWKTAVLYHALHASALVLYGLFDRNGRGRVAGWSFALGIVIFSGTVYALALGAPKWFGAITPIGGGLLVLGWLAFAVNASRRN